MSKIQTYTRYLLDFLKHGDFKSVIASVKYVLNKSSHGNDRIIQTSIGTFFCRKNTNDFQFANYYYEWGVKRFILNKKNEFTTFIDAGSCVGDYCILLAKLGKQCFAIEPVPDNIKIIRNNLELNNLQNKVIVLPYGLGDDDYFSSFTFDPINTGASRVNKIQKQEAGKVEIRKLDTLIKEMHIDQKETILLKLDIEGMEAEAIRGAYEFLKYYPNITLIIEDKHSGRKPINDALAEIAVFEFGEVDEFNMYAKKIRNY